MAWSVEADTESKNSNEIKNSYTNKDKGNWKLKIKMLKIN